MKTISQSIKSRKFRLILETIAGMVLAYYAGISIISHNPYSWLLISALFLLFILFENSVFGFYIIMFSVFFADWFVQLGLISTQLSWLPEVVLVLLTLKVITLRIKDKKFMRTPIDIPVLLFILLGVTSAFINSRSFIETFLAFRLDLRFILMFYILVNLSLPEKFYTTMIKIFLFLLIIQVPTALIKYTIYGQGEMAIGTYSLWGGTYSTLLPLVAISLFVSMFLHKRIRLIYMLVLIFGFIVFSIVGGKKGLIYFGPLLVLFILLESGLLKSAKRKFYKIVIISGIVLIMFVPIIHYVPWLKPAVGNPRYLGRFITTYDIQYSQSGYPAGRIPSIVETFETLIDDPVKFLIGCGPGSMIKSYFKQYDTRASHNQPVWIEYGITELVQKPIEYGYLGFVFYFLMPLFLFYKMNERFYRNIDDNYWKSISFGFAGILFSCFIIGIIYSAFLRSDLAGFIFWFFAATIYTIGKQKNII